MLVSHPVRSNVFVRGRGLYTTPLKPIGYIRQGQLYVVKGVEKSAELTTPRVHSAEKPVRAKSSTGGGLSKSSRQKLWNLGKGLKYL